MSNETIVFHNERIFVLDDSDPIDSDSEIEYYEDDNSDNGTNALINDIYSNEHQWDTMQRPSYRFRPDIWCDVVFEDE